MGSFINLDYFCLVKYTSCRTQSHTINTIGKLHKLYPKQICINVKLIFKKKQQNKTHPKRW